MANRKSSTEEATEKMGSKVMLVRTKNATTDVSVATPLRVSIRLTWAPLR